MVIENRNKMEVIKEKYYINNQDSKILRYNLFRNYIFIVI